MNEFMESVLNFSFDVETDIVVFETDVLQWSWGYSFSRRFINLKWFQLLELKFDEHDKFRFWHMIDYEDSPVLSILIFISISYRERWQTCNDHACFFRDIFSSQSNSCIVQI